MPVERRLYEVSVESSLGSTLAVIYYWEDDRTRIGTMRKTQIVVASGMSDSPQGAVLNAALQWAGKHAQGGSQATE